MKKEKKMSKRRNPKGHIYSVTHEHQVVHLARDKDTQPLTAGGADRT